MYGFSLKIDITGNVTLSDVFWVPGGLKSISEATPESDGYFQVYDQREQADFIRSVIAMVMLDHPPQDLHYLLEEQKNDNSNKIEKSGNGIHTGT